MCGTLDACEFSNMRPAHVSPPLPEARDSELRFGHWTPPSSGTNAACVLPGAPVLVSMASFTISKKLFVILRQ